MLSVRWSDSSPHTREHLMEEVTVAKKKAAAKKVAKKPAAKKPAAKKPAAKKVAKKAKCCCCKK